MAALYLLRGLPLRARLHQHHLSTVFFAQLRRSACTVSAESTGFEELAAPPSAQDAETVLRVKEPPQLRRIDDSDYHLWKDKEREIMRDIEPISLLTKQILHSNRYKDGERLTAEDEKAVIDKLLAHHPHSEDKIGCGLDSIIVDRHPQFRCSRCLFVVRSDGGWIDFSYQKCLREYIRLKYPSHAERFIREHFKRGS